MTVAGTTRRYADVVVVDLRGSDVVAAAEIVRAALHGPAIRAAGPTWSVPPARSRRQDADRDVDDHPRAVVIDDSHQLTAHHDIYESIFRSNRLDSLVVVAVGRPLDRSTATVLRATPVLGGEQTPVLWVGDEAGVAWRPGSAAQDPNTVQDGDGSGLDRLIEALRIPAVFDQVTREATRVPSSVCSPGLGIAAGRVDPDTIRSAQRRALRVVAGEPDADATGVVDLDECDVLQGRPERLPDAYTPVRPDGPLARDARDVLLRCAAATQHLRDLRGLAGLLRPDRSGAAAWQHVVAAGHAVRRRHDGLADLFDRSHAPGTLDHAQRADLQRRGISFAPPPGVDRNAVLNHLIQVVTAGPGRRPVRDLAADLRLVSERAMPAGSAGYLDRLPATGATALADRLVDPPPVQMNRAPAGVLAAAFATSVLAAVGVVPVGPVLAAATVVAWLVAAVLVGVRSPAPSGRSAAWHPALLGFALAVTAGVLVGRFVAGRVPVPTAVSVVVGVAAVAATLVTVRFWWTAGVDRWARDVGLAGAADVTARTDRVLRETAAMEWVLADLRMLLAEASAVLAGALRDVADTMDTHLDLLGGPAQTSTLRWDRTDAEETGDLQAVVNADVTDAVREVLAPRLPLLAAGSLDRVRPGVAVDTAHLLAEYDQHLSRRNVHQRPRFARSAADDETVLAGVWGPPGRIAAAMTAGTADRLVQLCTADDLNFLQGNGRSGIVRFAPRAIRPLLLDSVDPLAMADLDEVVWTGSGQLAGVVRLMPMRPGTIELTWPKGDDHAAGL